MLWVIRGMAISELERLSQAICPGNSLTLGTIIGFCCTIAVQQTPLGRLRFWQANEP